MSPRPSLRSMLAFAARSRSVRVSGGRFDGRGMWAQWHGWDTVARGQCRVRWCLEHRQVVRIFTTGVVCARLCHYRPWRTGVQPHASGGAIPLTGNRGSLPWGWHEWDSVHLMTQHTSTSTSDVADVIRRRRAQLGASQIEAARMAGISRRTWGQIELGHRVGNKATLYKIAEALQ